MYCTIGSTFWCVHIFKLKVGIFLASIDLCDQSLSEYCVHETGTALFASPYGNKVKYIIKELTCTCLAAWLTWYEKKKSRSIRRKQQE